MGRIFALLILILILAPSPIQGQGELSIILKTNPAAAQIGPDSTFVHTIISVVNSEGQAVPNAYLKLHLDAPSGSPFVSTDFPIVENTPLMSYSGFLPEGVLEFDYIYPIRGTYIFEVEAGQDSTAQSVKDSLSLNLSENRNEVVNFIIFLLILLGLGIVAGFFIGRGARAQQASTAGLLLLSISLIGYSVSSVHAHGGDDISEVAPFNEQSSQGDITLTYSMNPGAGKVGTLNTLNFTATDQDNTLIPNTTFEVAFWHIEDEKPVFATHLYAPTGQTEMEFQFFDGADHEVQVVAHNSLGSVNLDKGVEVEGLDPPFLTKVKTTFYLVVVTFIGILIGLRLQVKQSKKQHFAPVAG